MRYAILADLNEFQTVSSGFVQCRKGSFLLTIQPKVQRMQHFQADNLFRNRLALTGHNTQLAINDVGNTKGAHFGLIPFHCCHIENVGLLHILFS